MALLVKKKLKWMMGLLVVFTLFFTVFGNRGLIKIYKLRKEIRRLEASIKSLKSLNKSLSNDIQKMKNEGLFQEHSARETLGMVRENEIIYEFSD